MHNGSLFIQYLFFAFIVFQFVVSYSDYFFFRFCFGFLFSSCHFTISCVCVCMHHHRVYLSVLDLFYPRLVSIFGAHCCYTFVHFEEQMNISVSINHRRWLNVRQSQGFRFVFRFFFHILTWIDSWVWYKRESKHRTNIEKETHTERKTKTATILMEMKERRICHSWRPYRNDLMR